MVIQLIESNKTNKNLRTIKTDNKTNKRLAGVRLLGMGIIRNSSRYRQIMEDDIIMIKQHQMPNYVHHPACYFYSRTQAQAEQEYVQVLVHIIAGQKMCQSGQISHARTTR